MSLMQLQEGYINGLDGIAVTVEARTAYKVLAFGIVIVVRRQ